MSSHAQTYKTEQSGWVVEFSEIGLNFLVDGKTGIRNEWSNLWQWFCCMMVANCDLSAKQSHQSGTQTGIKKYTCAEARCPARQMVVNAREWHNNASWSSVAYTSVAYTTSGSKARSNARWRWRSLAFKTRWRMCFSYKSFTFICFHANFSSFSFADRQNTYSCKSDLFAN